MRSLDELEKYGLCYYSIYAMLAMDPFFLYEKKKKKKKISSFKKDVSVPRVMSADLYMGDRYGE